MAETNSNTMQMIVKTYEHEGQTLNVSFTKNGFFNATAVAKTFGKKPADWLNNSSTKDYIKAISRKLNVDEDKLVSVVSGGNDPKTLFHESLKERFIVWLSRKKSSNKNYHLYILLFSTGIIKVGSSHNGLIRIKNHAYDASKFGVSIIRDYVNLNPNVTEKELIDYCSSISNCHVGKEYFSELNFDDAVAFIEGSGNSNTRDLVIA